MDLTHWKHGLAIVGQNNKKNDGVNKIGDFVYAITKEVYQAHALNLLGQRLDLCTADQKEINETLKWIIRIEL